jgi:hypothetical protein
MTFKEGENVVTAPAAGDYAIRIIAKSGSDSFPARSFQASVGCDNPLPFDGSLVDVSKISQSGGDNIYAFSAAGAVSAAIGGQAPYLCAWDYNGDSSRDSLFGDCNATASNVYENYVGDRKVNLVVKDSCNVSTSVEAVLTFPPITKVPGAGIVFIHGKVVAGTGASLTHPAIFENSVGSDYWATNHPSDYIPVHAETWLNGAQSVFTISSDKFKYGAPSSETFGMKLEMSNIAITLTEGDDIAKPTIVDVTNARLASIKYSTDRIGDGQPAINLSGNECTLHDQGARVVQIIGTPCDPGQTNPDFTNKAMRWTIEVWGYYSCRNVSSGSASATIEGEFDGYSDLNDGCSGGGQGGQGGDQPPNF